MLAQCCLPLSMSNEVKVWSCLASLRAVQSRQSMRQSPLLKLTGRRNDRAGHTARSKEGADAVGPTPSATPARPASRQMRLRRPFERLYWLISNPMKEYCAAKRSKRNHEQWYTKSSRLPKSLVNVSTGRPPLFSSSQQDHRIDDRRGQLSKIFG
jgi:hypothetical protein